MELLLPGLAVSGLLTQVVASELHVGLVAVSLIAEAAQLSAKSSQHIEKKTARKPMLYVKKRKP